METFQEVKDRRDKPQQQRGRGGRRGGQRGGAGGPQSYRPKTAAPQHQKDGDVVMKEESSPAQSQQQAKKKQVGASEISHEQPVAATSQPVQEKKPQQARQGKKPAAKSHVPSEEPGFTGEPDQWFDGKRKYGVINFPHL
jgi:hypothetical protein